MHGTKTIKLKKNYISVKCPIILSHIIQNYKNDRFLGFHYGISWTSVHRFSNSFLYIDGGWDLIADMQENRRN
jgi:hypothetical protein